MMNRHPLGGMRNFILPEAYTGYVLLYEIAFYEEVDVHE